MSQANQTPMIESPATALEQLSDNDLVRLAKAGDSAAFAFLLERNGPRLFRSIRSILRRTEDVQDALQECFLKAWLYLDRFEERAQFSTWLTRIAINEALIFIRRNRSVDSCPDSVFDIADSRQCPQQHYLRYETSTFLWREVARLPRELQTTVTMRYAHDLSTNEMACSLAISEAAVKSRLYRGRLRLRKRIMDRNLESRKWVSTHSSDAGMYQGTPSRPNSLSSMS